MSGRGTIAGVIGALEADAHRYGRHVTEMLAEGARPAGAEALEYAAALRRLDREVSLILDEVGPTARARCLAMHVLAVGEAAHALDPADVLLPADGGR
jgi:hypothetical protein